MMSDSAKNLVGKIPGLIKAEIGENFADSDCDFVFYAEFERMENIPAFQVHPLHVAHKERSAPVCKNTLCRRLRFGVIKTLFNIVERLVS